MILRVIFILLFAHQTFGQNYTLKSIPVRNELNTDLLTSEPFIDKDGFIWYAVNSEGIFYKYDGRNQIKYSIYIKNRKRVTISTASVYNWIQDKNDNIWAITIEGAYIINPKTFELKYIKWKPSKSNLRDFQLLASILDHKGNIWVSLGEDYIIRFDRKYHQKIFSFPEQLKEKEAAPNSSSAKIKLKLLKVLKGERFLIKSVLNLYIFNNSGIHYVDKLKYDSSKIHFAENGVIFPANRSGTYHFNGRKYTYRYLKEFGLQMFEYPYDNFLHVKSKFFTVDENNLFIGSVTKNAIPFKITDTVDFKNSIINNRLLAGINNVVWFSTNDNIFMIKANDGRFKKHIQNEDYKISTRGIVSDKYGNLYIGSYHGLFKLNTFKNTLSKIIDLQYPFNYYNSLLIQNDSILWAVAEDNFIKSINLNSGKIKTFRHEGKEKLRSIFIKEKSADSLWVGSEKGLFVFIKSSSKFERYKTQGIRKDFFVYDVLKGSNGILWIATDKGLYFRRRGKQFLNYSVKSGFFKDKIILVIHEDKNKNIWIGTNNSGAALLNFKTGKTEVYDQTNGLSNNTVCGILESYEQIWFSTFYGISVLNKNTKKFNNFYVRDGLSDNEFNMRSFHKKDNYTFYFGGLNGITELNPKNFKFHKKQYRVYISKKEYYSEIKSKNVTDYVHNFEKIKLPYDKNYFSAEFTINDMYDHEKSTYYYKIDGLTDGWLNAGPSGLIKLYNLPAGDYLMEVKGKDFEGSETVNKIGIRIEVEQIFFKNPFFLGFATILVACFIIFEFRRKTKKQKRRYEREKEIIALKANALKAQMNPHFVFNILNNMQSIMILKGESEANKYFGAFSRLLRLTLDMSKRELVSLEDELQYIKYYLMLNNLQLNNKLEFFIECDAIKNVSNLFIPGMLIQPFVENAIIHGLSPKEEGDKIIKIKCFIENDCLFVIIQDNGIGRKAASELVKKREYAHKSWSTEIVRERINVMNASSKSLHISFTIEDNVFNGRALGTTVIISFKIR
ncbi:hypothetical protein B0A81_18625 [Flavobacterium plurextorum]|uniref:Two component regulator propeller n=1 Tax=Flavobacterium plurextorum TaxID=1114867 RepID=A0ABX4CPW1_9FLAO|nr:histidine kinase [Flavobacterium plurextorum]OXB03347.1 hypothetical protein B0A81_18625 [Flavobacterium plurextorum]